VDLCIHSPFRLHGVVLNYMSTGTTLPFFYNNNVTDLVRKFICIYLRVFINDRVSIRNSRSAAPMDMQTSNVQWP
jgi:hypothetical protein